MNVKMSGFVKRFSYAFLANILSTLVTLITTLFIPKFLGDDIASYGYYQIYFFYIMYVGFFHFGWCDGILLREGGKQYQDLDKRLYSSQFWELFLMELVVGLTISAGISIFSSEKEYVFLANMVACNVVLLCTRQFLLYVLQATNRIKEYSIVTVIGRVLYLLSILSVFFIGVKSYRYFVFGDIAAKLLSLTTGCIFCRDIVFRIPGNFYQGLKEAGKNIKAGISLLFANIAGHLIIGIVRIGIQSRWDVATYGKVSFTLSVSNLLQVFVGAVSIVLYPSLKRVEIEKLPGIYGTLRDLLMIPALGLLVLYYPIELLLGGWLPQYADSLRYMAILFPLCIFSAKQMMIVQTYMQVYRLEKEIMKSNIWGVVIAMISTGISVYLYENLTMAMIAIVINQIFRCVYAEIKLQKSVKISIYRDIVLELSMTMIFIWTGWYIGEWKGVLIYALFYLGYLFLKRKDIQAMKLSGK